MNIYGDLQLPERAKIEAALRHNDAEALSRIVVAVALSEADGPFSERLCQELALHSDETVRGNAILGFGHLARRFRKLQPESTKFIENGLKDSSEYVRGQAWAAASDATFFLKLKIAGFHSEDDGVR